MVSQSYFIIYTGEDELKYITNVINKYQKNVFDKIKTDDEIGLDDEIDNFIKCICLAKIINHDLFEKYALLFSIGNGRGYCENLFVSSGIFLCFYEYEIDENLEPKDEWYYHKEKLFLQENFSDEMYKINYAKMFTIQQRKYILNYIKKDKTYWSKEILDFEDIELSEIHREIQKIGKNK